MMQINQWHECKKKKSTSNNKLGLQRKGTLKKGLTIMTHKFGLEEKLSQKFENKQYT
jgi:hypothetical protein